MPGGLQAVSNGDGLERAVGRIADEMGLGVARQVRVGRRLWGPVRKIDLVVRHHDSGRSLGIECKFQGGAGTAEEKIPAIIQDIAAWPIPGLVVFAGDGFSDNMWAYLHSTGKAVAFEDLQDWLNLFFGIEPG